MKIQMEEKDDSSGPPVNRTTVRVSRRFLWFIFYRNAHTERQDVQDMQDVQYVAITPSSSVATTPRLRRCPRYRNRQRTMPTLHFQQPGLSVNARNEMPQQWRSWMEAEELVERVRRLNQAVAHKGGEDCGLNSTHCARPCHQFFFWLPGEARLNQRLRFKSKHVILGRPWMMRKLERRNTM
ncbi:hypothetical protein C1H46_043917 [Malus baccata]|uniref:Uncharacterized protein n=1 Tax=Malus baccata TaxID=106549 RepID=A0A540K8R4_MALBA|nr:hypothetical protein C1H46_043917 [Malus baccata]